MIRAAIARERPGRQTRLRSFHRSLLVAALSEIVRHEKPPRFTDSADNMEVHPPAASDSMVVLASRRRVAPPRETTCPQ